MPEEEVSLEALQGVPESTWTKLSQKKIFFGHQSVGYNIIDGVKDLMGEFPRIKLNIIKTSDPADFNKPLFAHTGVGKNTNPQSKIDAFAGIMQNGIGSKADIAFFKFCLVDITAETDAQKVFAEYKNAMSRLQKM